MMSQENLPPGFRFHPTDEELITYYLRRKFSEFGFSPKAIADVDLNKCEPWDLPCMAKMGEKEWYFFSLRDRKYPTGLRTNRATKSGYWKTTGKDKEIFQNGAQVGMKKTLVFYKGRAPKGEKSNWVMHEYRHQPQYPYKPNKEEWVVCRIFMKNSNNSKKPTSSTSSQATPSMMDSPSNTNSAGDLGDFDMSVLNNLLTNPTSLSSASTSTNYNITSSSIDMDNGNNNPIINNKMDMSAYMRCVPSKDAANQQQTLLSWPDGLLGSNASILRALQLNAYSQPTSTACFSTSANIRGDGLKLNLPTSSSNGGESAQQQHFEESLWRNY